MATSTPVAARNRRVVRKTITFAGGSGTGAVGTVAGVTTTGTVWLECLNIHCVTGLTSSGGTISLGISGDTAALIPVTTASEIDTGEQWVDTVPSKVDQGITNITLSDSLIFTVATADITAGVLEVEMIFHSLSSDGNMS